MRIIAGEFRRRVLLAPPGFNTRPMPDRVKESVFGMLGEAVVGADVLDLFSGSGAIGLEAISRGARSVLLVEQDRKAAAVIQKNIDTLNCTDRARVVIGDALGAAIVARTPRPTKLVFMDPPYPLVQNPATWTRVKAQAEALVQVLAPDGFLLLRTPWPFLFDEGAAEEAEETGRPLKRFTPKPGAKRGKGSGGRGRGDREAFGLDDRRRRPDAPPAPTRAKPPRHEHLHAMDLTDETLDNESFGDEGEEIGPDGIPLPPGFHEAVAKQNMRKEVVDLTLAGAKGPETHEYGKTAVHVYMKA